MSLRNLHTSARMQWFALASLGLLLLLLIISIGCRASAVWLSWVRAFAEAGIAGAIADWYAAAESGVEVCTALRSLRSPAQVRTV